MYPHFRSKSASYNKLQRVASFFFFSSSEKIFRSERFARSRIGFQSFSRSIRNILSLSLPPFLSFLHLNSILPIHRIEENLSNSPFRESVASRRGAIFLFDRAKPGFLFLFFFVQRSEHIHAISRYKVETCYGYWRRGR